MITVFSYKSFTKLQSLQTVSCTNFIGSDKYYKSAPFKNADRQRCSTVQLNEHNYSKIICPIKKLLGTRDCAERAD